MTQHAVDAVAKAQPLLLGLDVDVGGPRADRIGEDRVHQLHERSALARVGDVLLVHRVDLGALGDHRELVGQVDVLELREGRLLLGRVEALQRQNDLGLRRHDRLDLEPRRKSDGVGRDHVGRVGHDQVQVAPLDEPRQAHVLHREVSRDAAQDLARDVHRHEVRGGDLELLGHDLADLDLGRVAQVQEEAAHACPSFPLLEDEHLFELRRGDDALLQEKVAHQLAASRLRLVRDGCRGFGHCLVRPASAWGDGGRDARDQESGLEGLGDQVHGAGLDRLRAPAFSAVPAEDQDGDGYRAGRGYLPKLADEIEPVGVGHGEIGEDDVRVERMVDTVHGLRHGRDTQTRGARHLQEGADELSGVVIVFHDQHPGTRQARVCRHGLSDHDRSGSIGR